MFDQLTHLPTFTAARVRIRWLEEGDIGALFAVFSDPVAMRYWSSPAMTDIAEAAKLLADIRAGFASRTLFQWGIERLATPGIIGTGTLFHLDAANGRCEIGFALAPTHWGQGFASEAIGLLIEVAFEHLGLRRIEADVDPRNAASVRALERHGFAREGLLRSRWCVGGEIQDSLMLGLLRNHGW